MAKPVIEILAECLPHGAGYRLSVSTGDGKVGSVHYPQENTWDRHEMEAWCEGPTLYARVWSPGFGKYTRVVRPEHLKRAV